MFFLSITLAVITLLGLYFINFKRKPLWASKLTVKWQSINNISLISSLVVLIITGILYSSVSPSIAFTGLITISVLSYSFFQTLFTDFLVRLADRVTLYISILVAFLVNLFILLTVYDQYMITLYFIFGFLSAIFIFLPKMMGASDGRAFLLVVLGTLPLLGVKFFSLGCLLFILGIVLFSLIKSVKMTIDNSSENSSNFKFFIKHFFGKTSIPAVPFIIGPFMSLMMLFPIL